MPESTMRPEGTLANLFLYFYPPNVPMEHFIYFSFQKRFHIDGHSTLLHAF
jgi:hypothetical protein